MRVIAIILALFTTTAPPALAQAMLADPELTQRVRGNLAEDPHLATGRIGVASMGGVVTLRGTVETTPMRERASRVVKEVFGVLAVDNNLRVAPAG